MIEPDTMTRPSGTHVPRLPAGRGAAAARVVAAVGTLLFLTAAADVPYGALATAPVVQASSPCPPRRAAPAGAADFHGQTLTTPNFAGQDLRNADFSGATLVSPMFIRADLRGADFSCATLLDSQLPGAMALPADFTLARLGAARFTGAQFNGVTYFTDADLTSADFSNTDISAPNRVIFGTRLAFSAADSSNVPPRPAFRGTTMNCDFVPQWKDLDLAGAIVGACAPQMKGKDFSNALLAGVVLNGANLDGTRFVGADLTQAKLMGASLQATDFSDARLIGAQLQGANLSGASLYRAVLQNDPSAGAPAASFTQDSASLIGAHLKNVNLAYAHLSGVHFDGANLYGDNTTAGTNGGCKTSGDDHAGFAQGCATVHGATLDTTFFPGAYLYGLDLSAAILSSVDFSAAVLIGSSFAGATITTEVGHGGATLFRGAHLQGADLSTATLACASAGCYDYSDAFLDFSSGTPTLELLLDGSRHNGFACGPACKPPTGTDVCVQIDYPGATRLPAGPNAAALICPDGNAAPCGPAGGTRWKSRYDTASPPFGVPPAWYDAAATYKNPPLAPDSPLRCNGLKSSAWTQFW